MVNGAPAGGPTLDWVLSLGAGREGENLRRAWRDACSDLATAWRAWADAGRETGAECRAVHLAAEDREEAAATALALWCAAHPEDPAARLDEASEEAAR
jgi:hypothetical protein